MRTPTTPEGLEKWDHLGWPRDVLAAWMDPGDNPEWHARAQQVVRDAMPVLARALDLEAAEVQLPPGQRRPRRLRYPGKTYANPPWQERDEESGT